MWTIAKTMIVATVLALGLQCGAAQAQLARTFVSAATGNDTNDCNRATPCRTFAEAHTKTLPNGEITVLDPGGYGAVTITKTISIINDGVGEAGTLVSGGLNGITIAAGPGDAVSLRGLTVKGIGFGGGNGIVFNTGRSLTIENCAVRNLTGAAPIGYGIKFFPNPAGAGSDLAVSNTFVADNQSDGILVQPALGLVRAVFSHVHVHGNGGNGIAVISGFGGSVLATVADSLASSNGQGGGATGFFAERAQLMVARSVAANNFYGLFAKGFNATLRVGQSAITGNQNSWGVDGGTVQSYGDNNIDGNVDGDPAPPTILKK
jgi:Right handed beta helix region